MKVALMLSGLPRKVQEGFDDTWKSIIDRYDTDVYLQCWKEDEWYKVPLVYNMAKSLHIQTPFKFTHFKKGIKLPHNDTSRPLPEYDVMSCFRQFPMFYSWQTVYQDIYDTNIHYDFVIRSRYDISNQSPIQLEMFDPNKLNMAPCGKYIDDNLCITSKHNSNIIFYNIFDKLIKISRESGTLNTAEHSWEILIKQSGLSTNISSELQFKLLRDNLLWWGDENGNIIDK